MVLPSFTEFFFCSSSSSSSGAVRFHFAVERGFPRFYYKKKRKSGIFRFVSFPFLSRSFADVDYLFVIVITVIIYFEVCGRRPCVLRSCFFFVSFLRFSSKKTKSKSKESETEKHKKKQNKNKTKMAPRGVAVTRFPPADRLPSFTEFFFSFCWLFM